MKIDLMPSGIDVLDAQVGGIARGQFTLIAGGPQSGKTCFILTAVIAALKRGEACCLITSETHEALLEFCEKYFELDLVPYIKQNQLTFLSFASSFEHKVRLRESLNPAFDELLQLTFHRGFKNIAIDTINCTLATKEAALLKRAVQHLINNVQKLGRSCLCSFELSEDGDKKSCFADFISALPCVIELKRHTNGSGTLTIHKSSWSTPRQNILLVDFVHGKGVLGKKSLTPIANFIHTPLGNQIPTPLTNRISTPTKNQIPKPIGNRAPTPLEIPQPKGSPRPNEVGLFKAQVKTVMLDDQGSLFNGQTTSRMTTISDFDEGSDNNDEVLKPGLKPISGKTY